MELVRTQREKILQERVLLGHSSWLIIATRGRRTRPSKPDLELQGYLCRRESPGVGPGPGLSVLVEGNLDGEIRVRTDRIIGSSDPGSLGTT